MLTGSQNTKNREKNINPVQLVLLAADNIVKKTYSIQVACFSESNVEDVFLSHI